jgi:hypothetical protein
MIYIKWYDLGSESGVKCKIIRTNLLNETINSNCCIWLILIPFFPEVLKEEKNILLLHAEQCHSPHNMRICDYSCGGHSKILKLFITRILGQNVLLKPTKCT